MPASKRLAVLGMLQPGWRTCLHSTLHPFVCFHQVAYAVCQLLLGDTAAAADTLGLGPGSDIKCDRTMLAFIKVSQCSLCSGRGKGDVVANLMSALPTRSRSGIRVCSCQRQLRFFCSARLGHLLIGQRCAPC